MNLTHVILPSRRLFNHRLWVVTAKSVDVSAMIDTDNPEMDETRSINRRVSTSFMAVFVRVKAPRGVIAQPQTKPRQAAPHAIRSMPI